jgi:tetratricopeptide (TPR) repeat protein
MVEFPLWYSHFLGVLALLVGLGEKRWVTLRLQKLLPLSAVAILSFSLLTLVRIWQDYSKLWTWLYVSLGVRQEQAESLHPYTEQVLAQLGRSLLVAYMDFPVSGAIGIDHNNLKEKIIFHERVMRFSPAPYVVYRQVLLLALDGREAEALNLLERAMRLYPDQIGWMLKTAADLLERDTGAVPAVVAAAQARLEAQGPRRMPQRAIP